MVQDYFLIDPDTTRQLLAWLSLLHCRKITHIHPCLSCFNWFGISVLYLTSVNTQKLINVFFRSRETKHFLVPVAGWHNDASPHFRLIILMILVMVVTKSLFRPQASQFLWVFFLCSSSLSLFQQSLYLYKTIQWVERSMLNIFS